MCNYEAFAESRTKCDYDSYSGVLHAFSRISVVYIGQPLEAGGIISFEWDCHSGKVFL